MRFPGWEQGPTMSAFVDATADVWDVRDTYQHLEDVAPKMIQAGAPALGSVSWVACFPDTHPSQMFGCVVLPGSLWQSTLGLTALRVPGAGEVVMTPVDRFILTGWRPKRGGKAQRGPEGPVAVEISPLMGLFGALLRGLETSIERAVAEASAASGGQEVRRAGNTLMVVMTLGFGKESGPPA